MYQQVRPFNQLTAGSIKGMCLRNVRLGFGIPAKYNTAWQCWLNAPQFTGDMPSGIDVPVYFAYTTTIGGKTDNYGHIGVRLASGKFWSDGKTYMSLSSYRLFHPSVHYRGWSDEVNDVKVLKYVAPQPANKMPPIGSRIKLTKGTVRNTFKAGTTTVAGTIRVTDETFIYTVRGYDPKYPNRILINSKSAGGDGVALALYFTSGVRIPGWTQV
jgi:hypothetical protein